MKKLRLFGVIIVIVLLSSGIFYFQSRKSVPQKVHYHAGFLVYVDGKLQDFSGLRYMNEEFCRLTPKELTSYDIQKEKAHLHDGVGDVVHVHREGAVWMDLFKNIGFIIPNSKTIRGYLNGKLIENILNQPIKPYDSVVIVIGSEKRVNLENYVSREHIKKIEKKSEGCSI